MEKKILKEELGLLEMLLKNEMKSYNYKLSEKKYLTEDFLKSFEIICKSPTLKSRFSFWLREKRGIDTYPNNPLWQPQTIDRN